MGNLQGQVNHVGAARHKNTTQALGVVANTDALAGELLQKLAPTF